MQVFTLPYAPDPLPLFAPVAQRHGATLLQSGNRRHYQSRYDIFSAEPIADVSFERGVLSVGPKRIPTDDPLSALDDALKALPQFPEPPSGVPFTGGFIGLFGYPLHQTLERHRPPPADPTQLPPLTGGYFDWAVVTDHYRRLTCLYSHRNQEATQELLDLLIQQPASTTDEFSGALAPFQPTSSAAHYEAAFEKIQNYIHAGDCYQTNLARHYKARVNPAEGWALYRRLQGIQGGAFSAYLSHPRGAILSLSPERLALRTMSRTGSTVETCPIKGTAPRLLDPALDAARAARLIASEKNRAENLMIVDLLRNDLGRIASIGSVTVRNLFELVSLPNVHHLVSTITASMPAEVSALDVMRALLPGGSITGAPKIAATDIINEVEAVGRSAYCGSIGYIASGGRMDMNIAIRTLVLEGDGSLHLWGGGAIVADSEVDAEAREIDHKIGSLMRAI